MTWWEARFTCMLNGAARLAPFWGGDLHVNPVYI
jgi:hypothetical protein